MFFYFVEEQSTEGLKIKHVFMMNWFFRKYLIQTKLYIFLNQQLPLQNSFVWKVIKSQRLGVSCNHYGLYCKFYCNKQILFSVCFTIISESTAMFVINYIINVTLRECYITVWHIWHCVTEKLEHLHIKFATESSTTLLKMICSWCNYYFYWTWFLLCKIVFSYMTFA